MNALQMNTLQMNTPQMNTPQMNTPQITHHKWTQRSSSEYTTNEKGAANTLQVHQNAAFEVSVLHWMQQVPEFVVSHAMAFEVSVLHRPVAHCRGRRLQLALFQLYACVCVLKICVHMRAHTLGRTCCPGSEVGRHKVFYQPCLTTTLEPVYL